MNTVKQKQALLLKEINRSVGLANIDKTLTSTDVVHSLSRYMVNFMCVQIGWESVGTDQLAELERNYYSNEPNLQLAILLQALNLLAMTEQVYATREQNERTISDIQGQGSDSGEPDSL